jgi:hypothetical protein
MKEQYHIIWELVLIIASIFIFRSIWLLMDIYLGTSHLIPLLIAGILLSIPPLYILTGHFEDKKKN